MLYIILIDLWKNFLIRNYYLYKKRILIIKECLLNDLKCFIEKMEKEKLEYLNEIILESQNNSRINSIFISNDKIVIHIDNYIKFYDLKNYSLITNIKIDLNSSIIKLKNGDIMCKNIFETNCLLIKNTNLKIIKKMLIFSYGFRFLFESSDKKIFLGDSNQINIYSKKIAYIC